MSGESCPPFPLPSATTQLSGGQLVATRGEATLLFAAVNAAVRPVFTSGADYVRYKKARVLAGNSGTQNLRPPQSAAIAQLQMLSCDDDIPR
jgi:hypothetical protein